MQTKICYILLVFQQFQTQLFGQNAKIDSLLNVLKTQNEDTNKVNLYRNIGVAYLNQDPKKGIEYFQKGIKLSRKLKYIKGLARNLINVGTGYSYLSNYDSTIMYADSGIKYSKIIGDPERLALVYLNKGDCYKNLGNYKLALIYCDTASYYAQKTKNIDRQARIYDIIGDIYNHQSQFSTGIEIQKKALALYKKDGNKIMIGSIYDDFATIFQQTNKLDSSIYYRKMAIKIGEEIKDYKNLSTYYYGAADLYLIQNNYKLATYFANKSLQYAENQNNNMQLSSSNVLLGKILNKQKKYKEAAEVGLKGLKYAKNENIYSWQYASAEVLAESYKGIGDYKLSNTYLSLLLVLKDTLSDQLFNEQVANLRSSFEFKEKDKEIQLLAKDNQINQQKIQQQRAYIFGAFAIALLALAGIWLAINRYKLRQRLKELEIRNQIAADLHDEVGSSLSSIQMLSQMVNNQPHTDEKERAILQKMSNNAKETMEKMSDIVWMIKPDENDATSLADRIQRFLYEIGESKNIECNFSTKNIESVELSMADRKNIYLIFKEAVNNAAKYSGTNKIEASLEYHEKRLILTVKDFGKGFDLEHIRRGNGLENIQNRAKELGGKLTINSSINIGTEIDLKIKI